MPTSSDIRNAARRAQSVIQWDATKLLAAHAKAEALHEAASPLYIKAFYAQPSTWNADIDTAHDATRAAAAATEAATLGWASMPTPDTRRANLASVLDTACFSARDESRNCRDYSARARDTSLNTEDRREALDECAGSHLEAAQAHHHAQLLIQDSRT